MDFLYLLLALTNVCTLLISLKAINQRDTARENLRHQTFWFDRLADHVFEHAKFADDNNVADVGYDSRQVLGKWNVYHEICRKFRQPEDK